MIGREFSEFLRSSNMSLLSLITLAIGPAIAKAILKSWLGDGVGNDVAGSLVDMFKEQAKQIRDQRATSHQLEQIGEQIAAKMLPVFEHESLNLTEQDRRAVA